MDTLQALLGIPDDEGNVDSALIATSQNDFSVVSVGELYKSINLIVQAQEPQPLALLAAVTAIGGSRLLAMTHIALYRIRDLFRQDAIRGYGYPNFTQFVDDFTGPEMPLSRSNVFAKLNDIQAWREQGCDWVTIRDLLAKTPMAGRDAVRLLIEPHADQPLVVDESTGEIVDEPLVVDSRPMPEYLRDLTSMGPGEARRDVRDKAGIPERFVKEAVYVKSVQRLLIHAVWDMEDVDIVVTEVGQTVARWLCGLLRVGMEVQ